MLQQCLHEVGALLIINARFNQNYSKPRSLAEGGWQIEPPRIFLLKFCCLTVCQKLRYNCSLFVNTYLTLIKPKRQTDLPWNFLALNFCSKMPAASDIIYVAVVAMEVN